MNKALSFLNPKRLTERYGNLYQEYFLHFCSKSMEFMEHQLIKPTKKSKNLSEMMISAENAAPTAFILDYMGNCGLKLMYDYLDRVFDTDISPTLAASYLIDAFPTITPAITSISGGSSDSCVSFLASDILVTRYVLFKHPIVDKTIFCKGNKFSSSDGFDFTVETSDFELSIVSLRPCYYESELHKFISLIDENLGQDTHYVLESANLIANNDGVGANNLHFVALLDAYGQPLYETPDNHQLTRVLHACQAIAANKIQKTEKRDEILDKMLRAKNKKPLIKKLLTTQDTYS